MKKEKVLLVWELNPESVQFYLFDVGSHEAMLARESSGLMINGDILGDEHPIWELEELLNTIEPVELAELEDMQYSPNIIAVFKAGFFL